MDTLEDLYYGNLLPQEKVSKLDDEMKELIGLLNRNEEKLTATLSDEQKETFEKYKDCNREISEICERNAFLNGFRLGARIIIEVVNN
ncbi:DUF6809 family protein [Ruminococcus bromii]|uniref:DUF6809 family protein n=1 Tax=Ruminococcus bromii TaxID=40518 RepID=UPI00265F284B|nr:DUF6809 family protein [Ruminococcus bromii]